MVLSFSGVFSFAAPRKEIVDAKNTLSARIDSIEMEKQMRKRQGESLAELEKESRRLQDSVALLRKELAESSEDGFPGIGGPGTKSLVRVVTRLVSKPAHIFDWIIIVVGLIALISGVILVGGFVHAVSLRIRKSSRQSPRHVQKKVRSDYLSVESGGVFPSGATTDAGKDTRDIALLRKRMQKDIDHIQRFNTAPSPFAHTESHDEIQQDEQDDKGTLKDAILQSAREGLTAQEISRKYHVSIDQVTLVLRIAEKGHSQNS